MDRALPNSMVGTCNIRDRLLEGNKGDEPHGEGEQATNLSYLALGMGTFCLEG